MERPRIPPGRKITVSAQNHAAMLEWAIAHNIRLRDVVDKIVAEWRVKTAMMKEENR